MLKLSMTKSSHTLIDRESGIKYHTPVDTFNQFKRELDRGFGRQYYLTLNHWQVEENGNRQLGLWGDEDEH
jgi:hypothetical protein